MSNTVTETNTDNTITDRGQSVNLDCLQELFDAESMRSAKAVLFTAQQQYQTPITFVREIWEKMQECDMFPYFGPYEREATVCDIQCAGGNLITPIAYAEKAFGCDIDDRIENPKFQFIKSNSMDLMETIDDVYPDTMFAVMNANPPFSKKWKDKDGKVWDSTEWTWNQCIARGRMGIFICSAKTGIKLGIDTHPYARLRWFVPGLWESANITVMVVAWHNPDAAPATDCYTMQERWRELRTIMREESGIHPDFNIWLDATDAIKTYLSTREKLKRKLTYKDMERLGNLNGKHPMTLVQERETRRLIDELVTDGVYKIEPRAAKVIKEAVADFHRVSSPIMPPTDFEAVAYADEEERLQLRDDYQAAWFTPGKWYDVDTQGFKWSKLLKRNKLAYDEAGNSYKEVHECIESGQDRMILVRDDWNRTHKFLAMPAPNDSMQHDESEVWKLFKKPDVKTIADKFPEVVARNKTALSMLEIFGDFKYYPGQVEYLSKIGVKDSALMAADTGTGKTLFCISMIAMKGPNKALIIAPQGMVRSAPDEDDNEVGESAAQWMDELNKFAPQLKVRQLFSMEDCENIKKKNGGELPNGVYVSYYEAMFSNGARESCPTNWTDEKLREIIKEEGFTLPEHPDNTKDGHASSIGKEKNGIRCILAPSMATLIGHEFDMILVDEAHRSCHLSSNLAQILIRLQPKYRFAVTATPIPNLVTDIFPLMGWLCVPDWYKGERRNAAWPFARNELRKFSDNFMAHERDITQEAIKRAANPQDRSRCEKVSPVLSSPARLLKVLKPTMAFISKEACNPNLVKCTITDIRVPVGEQQGELYRHFTNRSNIPMNNPLSRARAQIAYLRNICADPSGFPTYDRGGPRVTSNFNPKTIAILNIVREIIAKSQQVVVVSARCGQTDTLQRYLIEAGVRVSRIDSTIPASRQAYEANQFKKKVSQVHLMGIKCAQGYSFPECQNLIVGSLEYTCGSLHQALGRVYRVNSLHDVNIWCVLNKLTIEETMYDQVATKQDAATICLHGKRVPRDYKPVDMDEIMAEALDRFSLSGARSEIECEDQWPAIRNAFRDALYTSSASHSAAYAANACSTDATAIAA